MNAYIKTPQGEVLKLPVKNTTTKGVICKMPIHSKVGPTTQLAIIESTVIHNEATEWFPEKSIIKFES